MNHVHAKAEYVQGAWRAMVRYSHRAGYWPVMKGDEPAAFPTKDAAEIAALRAQEKHINGTIRGFGERASTAALGGIIHKQRIIPVERRKVRA